MKYREAIKIAVNALKINRARALLTILGIVIMMQIEIHAQVLLEQCL